MTGIHQESSLVPTQDERTMATLAQALQLIGGWIAPLVIFLIRRQSRFVSFHALQALLLQIVHVIVVFVAVFIWIFVVFFSFIPQIANQTSHPGNGPPFPPAFFVFFPLLWLLLVGVGIFNLVVAIVYSIKAGQGEWAEYPLLGRLARKFLKMGPGGTTIPSQG